MMRTGTVGVVIAFIFVVLFTAIGVWVGTPPLSDGAGFTQALALFAADAKTRLILLAILLDVITGIAAALHLRSFDTVMLARFYATNVLPYVLGFFLVWCLLLLGVATMLAPPLPTVLLALAFALIITSLIASITDNLVAWKAAPGSPAL